ncbi:MAG: hypothetical protein KGR26_01140, partial [Cyanobacteria bacterium REEB65]|nr:hypothetical protein [Cyanobacteria bacterium REEB65]
LRRHDAMGDAQLLFLPETRFTCQGSGACCTHDMTIGMEANTERFIVESDWQACQPDLQGPFLREVPATSRSFVPFGQVLARDDAGRCRFLTAGSRCSVHHLVGRAVFKPCHVFPYQFARCPDGICVTVHHFCPTARLAKGMPSCEQQADVRSRLALARPLQTTAYRLLKTVAVDWPRFKAIEATLLEILQPDRPIRAKLWAALTWLDALLCEADPAFDPSRYDEAIPPVSAAEWATFEDFVGLFDPYFARLDARCAGPISLQDYEPVLTRWFRSLLFGKITTFPHGLVAGMNDLAVIYRILERQVRLHGKPRVSDHFWREFFGLIATPGGNFRNYLAESHNNPRFVLSKLGENPKLGMNLLRRPA